MYLHITIIFAICTNQIQTDAILQRMLNNELKISKYIGTHVEQLATVVTQVERDLYKLISSKWSQLGRADYVATPLTSMVMMGRLVRDWPVLVTTVGRLSKLHQLQLSQVRWPTMTDLEATAKAMMRAHMTYDLNTALLVRGVQSDTFLTNMTASDCFEIARHYFIKEHFHEATEWLQHALAGIHDGDGDPLRETALYYMAAALCFTGDERNSINILRDIFKENPLSKAPKYLIDYFKIMGTRGCIYPDEAILLYLDEKYYRSKMDLAAVGFFRNKKEVENHNKLCRGKYNNDSDLRCYYVHYHQPHLRFQPFKLEEIQLDPPVVRFYDLVSDIEAESLKRRAKNQMKPASVGVMAYKRVTEYRTSLVAWLAANGTDWLDRRISEATRLNTYEAEQHQVSRYSVSGEYLPHMDYMGHGWKWTSDRIATIMVYLNDVEQGGNTVFTHWNLSVPPVRNSAVLWFNYKPSGEGDQDSEHGGCPVLKGTKWVLNKWFHNGHNQVNFLCPLHRQGSFKGFYL